MGSHWEIIGNLLVKGQSTRWVETHPLNRCLVSGWDYRAVHQLRIGHLLRVWLIGNDDMGNHWEKKWGKLLAKENLKSLYQPECLTRSMNIIF